MEPLSLESFLLLNLPDPVEIIGKGILHEQSKAIVYGEKKLGKSVLMLQLLMSLRHGIPWLGFETPTSGIDSFYLQTEVADAQLLKRLKKSYGIWAQNHLHLPKKAETTVWSTRGQPLKLDTPEGASLLYKHLESYQPRIVVLDPSYKLISKPNDPDAVLNMQDNLDIAIEKYNCAVLIIAHPRKPGQDAVNHAHETSYDLYGPGLWTNWVDATIKLTHNPNHPQDVRTLSILDTRNAEEDVPAINIRLNRTTLMFEQTLVV